MTMSDSLRDIVINYRADSLLGDEVHVVGKKNGKVVFDGIYKVYASVETNYSKIAVMWPSDGILPGEFQDHYGSTANRYPVEIEYEEDEDTLALSGKYQGEPYEVFIKLPEKRIY